MNETIKQILILGGYFFGAVIVILIYFSIENWITKFFNKMWKR